MIDLENADQNGAQQMAFRFVEQAGSLRWRERRARYRPLQECIDPRQYAVGQIDAAIARDFVIRHHYSGTSVADRYSSGLFYAPKGGPSKLVGVAIFSVPAGPAVLAKHLGAGNDSGVELGRFVLLDDVPAMAESWFGARAFRDAKKALGIKRILACSDPMPRHDAAGNLIKVAHGGTIYRALNARYGGRTRPRNLLVMPTGRVFNERTATKLATNDTGAAGALKMLADHGAPPRAIHEDGRTYLARLKQSGFFRTLRHPGNLVWTWGVPTQ